METTDVVPMNIPTVDLVDRVKAALSGKPYEHSVEKMATKKTKIDGRSKEFRSVIKRIEARKTKKNKIENE